MTKNAIVLLIFSMTAVLVSSWDIYAPISPQLSNIFSVPENIMKFTFLVGPLASGLIGIPVGYLSDRHGRRPLLLLGLFLYCLGTFLCTMSPSITYFFLGRILQSFGVGGLLVLSAAILSDLFDGVTLARYMGLYALIFPVAFAVAPIIGAQIYTWLGWRAVFWALILGITPIYFFIVIHLPETCKAKGDGATFSLLQKMATSKLMLSLALTHSVPITIGAIFTANGAFLYHNLFHFGPVSFSIVQAIPVTVQCLGTLVYRRVVRENGLEKTLHIGSLVAGMYSVVCLLMIFGVIQGPWITVAAISLFTMGSTFIIMSAATLLMDCSQDSKGLAASFLNLVRNLVIAIVMTGASFLPYQSVSPIFSVMLLISLTTLFLITLTMQQLKKREVVSPNV